MLVDRRALMMGLTLIIGAPSDAQNAPRYVFFDWAKTVPREDSKALLDAVAQEFATNGRRIRLDGFSDRSGPSATNLRASRVRAEQVRALLVQRGIPPTGMTIAGHGEGNPVVLTEDGVREGQNRRVEIRLEP